LLQNIINIDKILLFYIVNKIAMKLEEFLKYLENKNKEFITDQQELSKMAKAQHPFMTLIECSDSRVDTSDIGFGGKDALDRVFRIENIGNTV
jgi:carbonic anhydrase